MAINLERISLQSHSCSSYPTNISRFVMSTPLLTFGLQTSKYFNVAAFAILVYDYWVIFQSEIHWMWGTKWGSTRIMFTISRYMPFLAVSMTCYGALKTRTGQNCMPFGRASSVWQRNRKLLFSLLMFAVASGVGALVMSQSSLPTTSQYGNIVNPNGCIFETDRSSMFPYIFLVFYESVLLCLTRFRTDRHSTCPVVNILVRDNMIYIACIISVSILNIVIGVAAPIPYLDMFDSLQIVIHSAVASRIMFNLRECDKSESEWSFSAALAEFQEMEAPPADGRAAPAIQ
ncbi:hypothetical protein BV22DRAFT_761046 [Leucogyrophana mollusca]|uniref:Uncharacterized protein n=1 Tax=Leucogyrophana mollusca TaxID=85980 RepID=A0ACB8B5G5_9AGAM|nr:hypothetical protein BV22DRAFT_761046 [Leucogyrophana mollusca]